MNNSEQDNPNFEEEWRRAFEEPELNPSNRVWAGLNHHLEGKVRQRRKRRFAYIGLAASCLLCLTWGVTSWNNSIVGEDSTAILSQSRKIQSKKSISKISTNEKERINSQAKRNPIALSGNSNNQNQHTQASTTDKALSIPTIAIIPQEKTSKTEEGKTLGVTEKSMVTLTEPKNKQVIASALPRLSSAGKKVLSGLTLSEANRQAANNQSPALNLKRTFKEPLSLGEPSHQKNKRALALHKDAATAKQGKKLKNLTRKEGLSVTVAIEEPLKNNKELNEGNVLAFLPTTAVGSLLVPSTILDDHLRHQLPIQILFPQPTEEELAAQKQKDGRPSSRWISSTFTPNYFNSNVKAAYQPSSSINTATSGLSNIYSTSAQKISKVQQEEDVSSPVFSYAAGVSAGTNLAKRWIVEAGIQYISNSTDLQTHAYLQNTATSKKHPIIADLLGASTDANLFENSPASVSLEVNNKLNNSPVVTELNPSFKPITLRNQYQSIGIPIKLGYQLYKQKKLGLVVSAGISTDVFLRNTINSSEADVSSTVISSGDKSAYKAVNFSGLLGVGVHYLYASRLSIVLEPNYRAALFSTTKTDSNVQTLPRNIGLGVGMKYHF